jgi:hypothetical protein
MSVRANSLVLPLHNQPFCQRETLNDGIGKADVDWLIAQGLLTGIDGYDWNAIETCPDLTRVQAFERSRLVRRVNREASTLLRQKRQNESKNVAFLMNDLGPYGGIKVCQQAAAELAERGWNASVCYCVQTGKPFQYGAAEFAFNGTKDLVENFTERVFSEGVVVLTHWWSAWLFKDLLEQNPQLKAVCYLQDREDWFTDEFNEPTLYPDARNEYLRHLDRAYVSRWIKDTLEDPSDDNPIIPPPLPRNYDKEPESKPSQRSGTIRVLSLWRPGTPRRGHRLLMKAHKELKRLYENNVSLEVYGEILTPCETADINHGWLREHEVLALLKQVDVVLEPSDYHGYGLAATEAMSQNVLVVSTENFGVEEYGIDEETLLLAGDTEEFIEKACKAIDLCRTPWADTIAERGRNFVAAHMDPARVGDLWDAWLCRRLQQD